MKKIFVIVTALLCASCKQSQDSFQIHNQAKDVQIYSEERFEVTRVQVINDDLAYEGKRGVYVIVDKQTGIEYFGVSGVGITELGSHTQSSGKTTVTYQDER